MMANKKEATKKKTSAESHPKETFTAIKKSLVDTGRTFSKGADKVADIILDASQKGRKEKGKRLKEEVVATFKGISDATKKSLKEVNPSDVLHDTFYELGRVSRITKDKCIEIIDKLKK